MDRFNGFLDLDEYFYAIESKYPQIDLYKDGLIVPSDYTSEGQYWLIINGAKYYFKETGFAHNEVIASYVANFLGLDAVKYDLAIFNGFYGVISTSFKKENCLYITGAQILEEYYQGNKDILKQMGLTEEWKERYKGPQYVTMNNLEIIWQALEKRYEKNSKANITELLDKIILQYIFSLLTCQGDKISYNWEIEESDEKISVAPIYDNETAFLEDSTVTMSTNFNDVDKTIEDSVKQFLNVSSEESISVFLKMFNALTINKFMEILEMVERNIKSPLPKNKKDSIIKAFINNRNKIENILKEMNLKDNRIF